MILGDVWESLHANNPLCSFWWSSKGSWVAKHSVQVLHSLCVCVCRCIMCANVFMQYLQWLMLFLFRSISYTDRIKLFYLKEPLFSFISSVVSHFDLATQWIMKRCVCDFLPHSCHISAGGQRSAWRQVWWAEMSWGGGVSQNQCKVHPREIEHAVNSSCRDSSGSSVQRGRMIQFMVLHILRRLRN